MRFSGSDFGLGKRVKVEYPKNKRVNFPNRCCITINRWYLTLFWGIKWFWFKNQKKIECTHLPKWPFKNRKYNFAELKVGNQYNIIIKLLVYYYNIVDKNWSDILLLLLYSLLFSSRSKFKSFCSDLESVIIILILYTYKKYTCIIFKKKKCVFLFAFLFRDNILNHDHSSYWY